MQIRQQKLSLPAGETPVYTDTFVFQIHQEFGANAEHRYLFANSSLSEECKCQRSPTNKAWIQLYSEVLRSNSDVQLKSVLWRERIWQQEKNILENGIHWAQRWYRRYEEGTRSVIHRGSLMWAGGMERNMGRCQEINCFWSFATYCVCRKLPWGKEISPFHIIWFPPRTKATVVIPWVPFHCVLIRLQGLVWEPGHSLLFALFLSENVWIPQQSYIQ